MTFSDLWRIVRKPAKRTTTRDDILRDDIAEKQRLQVEERKLEIELEKLRLEQIRSAEHRKKLQDIKADLDDDDDDYDDDEDDDLDAIADTFGSILEKATGGNKRTVAPPNIPAPQMQIRKAISDDEIRDFLDKQKKGHLRLAKSMPKEVLKNKAMHDMGIGDEEAERAYKILVEEY